jgi:hypothetical protein
LGVVGAAAVAAGVAFWWRLPISFQIDADAGAAAVAGNAGDLIEANAVTPTALRFSEGSSIVLERGGQLRVLALESNGARVLVEKGSADVAITHRHGPGKWRFEAGPVTVNVTGTRFRLDWDPERHAFGIELKEGSVIVGGDCLPAPRRVQRGDNLRVVCRSANAVDLLALADAARLSGETSRAVDALLTLRQRFPGSTSAATGAFSLGRLAFDQRGAYAEAARWFATYLNDQPQGPLMADAIGRLMEARDRAGDRQAARGDAARYLQRFPDGPYAGTARVILAN